LLCARVVLLMHPNGVPLDVALGAFDFERRTIERSSIWRVTERCKLRTCSAEDLVVHKAFAAAPKIGRTSSIARLRGDKLNTRQILEELEPLAALKEQPEIVTQLRTLLEKFGA
jgi:hypothetical protein